MDLKELRDIAEAARDTSWKARLRCIDATSYIGRNEYTELAIAMDNALCELLNALDKFEAGPGGCSGCVSKGGPSHQGSTSCKSGSLASGGQNSHCSCDTCF